MSKTKTSVEEIMEAMTGSIGPIMKAARKFKKLNQSEVASAIGCSQSALSKMEHNLLVPSAPQWFLFTQFTSIPAESLVRGVIHRQTAVKFNSDEVSLGFKIPRRYRQQRAEKVRELYPFIKFLQKNYPNEHKTFIQESEIDAEFFLDFDNLVNFQLVAKMFECLMGLKRDSAQDIAEIVKTYQDDVFWEVGGVDWKKVTTPEELISMFANRQTSFQSDFQIAIERRQGTFSITYRPEYHLKGFDDLQGKVTQFLNNYRKATLENLVRRSLGSDVKLELVEQPAPLAARFELKY